MTIDEELMQNNIMLSKYLYGESQVTNYYQVGYVGNNPIYRHRDHLCNPLHTNFNTNWAFLMDVISKIAKDPIDDFSDEDRLREELKNTIFQFSYDVNEAWKVVVKIVKLKLIV